MKFNSITADINLIRNKLKVFSGLAIVLLNLKLYKKAFDFTILSNLPNIFFRSWIILEEIIYVFADIGFALALITPKAIFLQ